MGECMISSRIRMQSYSRHPIDRYQASLERMHEEERGITSPGLGSRNHLVWDPIAGWSSAIQRELRAEGPKRTQEHARAWLDVERANYGRAVERAVERADRRRAVQEARQRAMREGPSSRAWLPDSRWPAPPRSVSPHAPSPDLFEAQWASLQIAATGETVHCGAGGEEVWDWEDREAEERELLIAEHTLRLHARQGRDVDLRQQAADEDRLELTSSDEAGRLMAQYRRFQSRGLREQAAR